MIRRIFGRRRSRVSRLLDAPLENIGRVRESLPAAILADVLSDLAARTGVELADVADRVLERVGDAVSRAGAEAELLAETDRARQLRDLAMRAGERAELAYRIGADRLLEAVPERRQRSSHRGLILFSAAAGLALGGAVAYLLLARPAERRPEEHQAESGEAEGSDADRAGLIESPPHSVAHPGPQGFFEELSQRFSHARRAARAAQRATERRLWHEYRTGGEVDR